MAISFVALVVCMSFKNDHKRWHTQEFCWLSCVMLSISTYLPTSLLSLLLKDLISIVIAYNANKEGPTG